MSWFNVWDGLKNKTCRYLLQRYLGQFLKEELNLEQLKIELFDGKATVNNVSLKLEALNEIFMANGWALEVIDGHIGTITVTVPWNALMTNETSIEISNLSITFRPTKIHNEGTSMLESMWSSASSSIQLAKACMQQNDEVDGVLQMNSNAIEGLEKFAETIDNVLNRIAAKFTNTTLTLEYTPSDSSKDFCVVFNIDNLSYKNETDCKILRQQLNNISNVSENVHQFPSFIEHSLRMSGLRFFTGETRHLRTGSEVIANLHNKNNKYETEEIESYIKNYGTSNILMAEVRDDQKIQIKVKQSEGLTGPQVWMDAEIGSVFIFMTPSQVHLLLKICNAFYEDDLDLKCGPNAQRNEKVLHTENQSVNIQRSYMTGVVGQRGNFEEQVDDKNESASYDKKNTDSSYQKFDKYCESLSSSVTSSGVATNLNRCQRKMINMDSYGEILNINARITSILIIILHQDMAVCDINNSQDLLSEQSQLNTIRAVNKFFSFVKNELRENHYEKTTEFCDKNHFVTFLSPIFVKGNQHRNKKILLYKFSLTSTKVDLLEVLNEIATPLIKFDRQEVKQTGYHKAPEFEMTLKSSTSCSTKEFNSLSFNIILLKFTLELDISIYDRLSLLFGSSNTKTKESFDTRKRVVQKSSIALNITTKSFDVKLRFPMADERTFNDPDRFPWWNKNIRDDFLLLEFLEPQLNIMADNIEIIANEINVFYCAKEECITKLQIIKVRPLENNNASTNEISLQYPRIVLHLPYAEESGYSVANSESNETKNVLNIPFSSKNECRHSDTFHIKHDETGTETFFLPGETQEIDAFSEGTMKLSKMLIKIRLPNITVNLESKQIYEILYNRINSDLLMWTPSSPVLQKKSRVPENVSQDFSIFVHTQENDRDKQEYVKKNSTEQVVNFLNGKDEMSSSNRSSIYFSTHEKNQSKVQKQKLCECSVKVSIESGIFTFFSPVRDQENHVIPSQLGKFILKTSNFELFSVSGFKSNDDLSYVCLQASDIQMFHSGLIPASAPVPMQAHNFDIEDFMQSTLYALPEQLPKLHRIGKMNRKMLSVVIEIKKLRDQHIKRLKIATGIQKIALRHNPAQASHSWINQLIDFLDVTDYPIQGFSPLGVITEIQLHLWDSAIDYRPKFIKHRAVMEFGSIVISSNIISTVAGCNLRFIAEELILSIAPFNNLDNSLKNNAVTYIPSKYLIPVLDVGLFDVSVRLCEKITKNCPQFDLRSSVHDVHLRTCADSGSAFTQVISYVANDGDFICEDIGKKLTISQSSSCAEADIFSNRECEENISQTQQERVNTLMADALRESMSSLENYEEYTQSSSTAHGVEVFYFPDENRSKQSHKESEDLVQNEFCDIINFETNVMLNSCSKNIHDNYLPQVKADFGDNKNHSTPRSKKTMQEDDYCIIADNEKSFLNQCGVKEVKLSDDPLKIVDNHFCLPISKSDLLKSPENFPMAVTRYTLCEMTFTWHMYGGNDFADTSSPAEDQPTKRERMSEAYRHGVSYSKNIENLQLFKKPKDKLTWKTIGGPRRNHEVLVEMQFSKIRFSHEVYPSLGSLASRQVLLISELEIRDRLQTSDINKFLYHPNIQKLSHKNSNQVIVIKALNMRPDPKRIGNQECSLRISLVPMRLHIDQDTLIFLADYFTSIGDDCNTKTHLPKNNDENGTCHSQTPIMAVEEMPNSVKDLRTRKLVVTNLDLLMDEQKSYPAEIIPINLPDTDDQRIIYFRELIFSPEISICFDYHGRHVELSRGPIAGLLMGLGQLQCSEIRLKKVVYRRGLLGWEKLITYICKEWLSDIKKNQLPKILSGVGPTYAFVQLFQGIYDLFWLPIEQYQKDGRIIRGLQLGAQSFTARTALAALEITSRIIQLLQFTAETAFDMVTPGPSVTRAHRIHKGKRKRQQRPKDFREGVSNAYHIVKEGINNSAHTLIETAVIEHDQKGYTGAVGAVMMQIPQLVVCPAVLATQATTNILGGVKNSIVPEAKIEDREKWKNDSD